MEDGSKTLQPHERRTRGITRSKTRFVEERALTKQQIMRMKTRKVLRVGSKSLLIFALYVLGFPIIMLFAAYNYADENIKNLVNFGTLGFYLGAG